MHRTVRVIHYSGALRVVRRGIATCIDAGSAACCSGQRARAIMQAGNLSRYACDVDCKRCLALIELAEAQGTLGVST